MASGSRGGYRPRSLRMRASAAGAPEDDEPLPQQLVDLPSADLLARLSHPLVGASSADSSGAAAHTLAELERRLHEAGNRDRASDELAAAMRGRVKLLQRSSTAAHEEIRRAAAAEIDAHKHTAAGHQAVVETLEQRAVGAEAQLRRASDSEALLKTKIHELEGKAATVEANHRAEIEGSVVKAEADLKEAAEHKIMTAMSFQVRLEAIVSEAKHTAATLEVSHGLKIQALESRVTDLEDEITSHRDRMATLARHFEARLEAIGSEAKRAADGIKDSYRFQIDEALQKRVTETKQRPSDEISKREALALECQQHLHAANDISEGECVTNEVMAKLLTNKISAGTKKAAELDSEIRDRAAELVAGFRRGVEEGDDTMAELKARIAKNRAMLANENYEEDGQQRSSPTHMPSAQTSDHHDVIDLTATSEDDV